MLEVWYSDKDLFWHDGMYQQKLPLHIGKSTWRNTPWMRQAGTFLLWGCVSEFLAIDWCLSFKLFKLSPFNGPVDPFINATVKAHRTCTLLQTLINPENHDSAGTANTICPLICWLTRRSYPLSRSLRLLFHSLWTVKGITHFGRNPLEIVWV